MESMNTHLSFIRRYRWIFFIGLIIVLLFAFRLPFLHDHFISDDFDWIQHARHNVESRQWLASFSEPVGANFYRPLVVVSFQIDYALFGYHPEGYRVHQLLFQLFFVVGSAWMISLLTKSRSLGFAAGIFLAVWPSHQEVVTWLAGRPDLYAATFTVFAVAACSRFLSTKKISWMIASILATVAAYLSKETSFIIPLLLIGTVALHGRLRDLKAFVRSLWVAIPSVALLIALLILRSSILTNAFGGYVTGDQSAALHPTLATLSKPFTSIFYLVDWSYVIKYFGENVFVTFLHRAVAMLVGHWILALGFFLCALAVVAWKSPTRFFLRPLSIAIAWSLITFIPVYSISAGINDSLDFSRLFFLSSVGYALILAVAFWPRLSANKMWSRIRIMLFVLSLVLFFFVGRLNVAPWHEASRQVKELLQTFAEQKKELLTDNPSNILFSRLPGEIENKPTFYANSITEPFFQITKDRSLRSFIDGSQPYASSPFCETYDYSSIAFITWNAASRTFSKEDTQFLSDASKVKLKKLTWDFQDPKTLQEWKVAGATTKQGTDGIEVTVESQKTFSLESPALESFTGASYKTLTLRFKTQNATLLYGQNVATLSWARVGQFHGGLSLKYAYPFQQNLTVTIPLCQYINWNVSDQVTTLRIAPVQSGTFVLSSISIQ